MDPISLILTALTAASAAFAKGALGEAGKEAYKELKARIQRKVADKPAAVTALAQYEAKPEVWKAPLRDALVEAEAGKDTDVLRAAQTVLTIVDPDQASVGKYSVQVAGDAQGIVAGDHAQVEMTFGSGSDDE